MMEIKEQNSQLQIKRFSYDPSSDSNNNNEKNEGLIQMRRGLRKAIRLNQIKSITYFDVNDKLVQQIVIEILNEKQKTIQEIEFLKKFIQFLPLFQKNPGLLTQPNAMLMLFNEMSIETYKKRQVIFNYGEFGYTYYIVLKGAVNLLIPKTSKNDNRQVNESPQSKNQIQLSGWDKIRERINSFKQTSLNNEDDLKEEDFLKKYYTNMNLIKTFYPGEAFGEIALLTKQRRTGTMICREESVVIVLQKNGFDKILGAYHEQLKMEQLGFLKKFPFFQSIPNSNLMSILLDMKIQSFSCKQVLFRQGDACQNIFFIKSGEIQLTKVVEQEKNNIGKQLIFAKKQEIPITILMEYNSLGGEDFVFQQKKRQITAQVRSSYAEIYVLDFQIFHNNLCMFRCWDIFVQEMKKRNEFLSKRIYEVSQIQKFEETILPTLSTSRYSSQNKSANIKDQFKQNFSRKFQSQLVKKIIQTKKKTQKQISLTNQMNQSIFDEYFNHENISFLKYSSDFTRKNSYNISRKNSENVKQNLALIIKEVK